MIIEPSAHAQSVVDLWLKAYPRFISEEAKQDLVTGVRLAMAERDAYHEAARRPGFLTVDATFKDGIDDNE